MFRLYKHDGTKTPMILEYYEEIPKISKEFKKKIQERFGGGAFFIQHYNRKGEKVHFVVEGLQKNQQNNEVSNMDMGTLLQFSEKLSRIESKIDLLQKSFDDTFEGGDFEEMDTPQPTKEESPEEKALSGLMEALGKNPKAIDGLSALGGIDGIKKLIGGL